MEAEGEAVPWRIEPPPRRRWPFVVLTLVLLAALSGAGAAAWVNYEAGSGWRERAFAEQARAVAAESRMEELERELDRTTGLLERSEEDVELLESRLEALASEKAGAEDSAAMAAEAAEDLTAVTRFAAAVGGELRDCISRNVSLTNDIITAYNAGDFDAAAINSRIGSVNDACADAQASYGELRNRLDALGG